MASADYVTNVKDGEDNKYQRVHTIISKDKLAQINLVDRISNEIVTAGMQGENEKSSLNNGNNSSLGDANRQRHSKINLEPIQKKITGIENGNGLR